MSNRKKIRPLRPLRQKLDPARAGLQLADLAEGRMGLLMIQVAHDDGCPAARTQREQDCICAPDLYAVAPFGLEVRR